MTSPMVPAALDLTDFDWMPFDFQRLFNSDTWALSNDAEKVAAITLWGKSWYQRPAGSLPSDDRILASTQFTATGPRWKKVKEIALRGWVLCEDGRYYHPVVCEKALEAWLEKLAQRISSGAGNAKRWGGEFDPTMLERHMQDARRFLIVLNPQSRTLSKKRTSGIPSGSKNRPNGNANGNPGRVPSGSQGTGTGTVKEQDQEQKQTEAGSNGTTDPTLAGAACLLMRKAGLAYTNPQHAGLLEALGLGITPAQLAAVGAEALRGDKPKPFAWAIATALSRHRSGEPIVPEPTDATSTRSSDTSAVGRVRANAEAGERRDREAGNDGTIVRIIG